MLNFFPHYNLKISLVCYLKNVIYIQYFLTVCLQFEILDQITFFHGRRGENLITFHEGKGINVGITFHKNVV